MPGTSNTEIERKFLVHRNLLPEAGPGRHIVQGYLSLEEENTVRIRVIDGKKGFLTVKGGDEGIERPEYEYEIPVGEAQEMLALCRYSPVEKIRRVIEHEGHEWEVDEFLCDNKGLWLAEIELSYKDEAFATPAWAGEEVSHDPRYYNVNLAREPFSKWGGGGKGMRPAPNSV